MKEQLSKIGRVVEIIWYLVLVILIPLVIFSGFLDPATEGRPSGSADVVAPLCALLVAFLALPTIFKAVVARRLYAPFPVLMGYAAAPFVAYFWFADAMALHPTDLDVVFFVTFLILAGIVIVTVLGLIGWLAFASIRTDDPDEDVEADEDAE